MNFCINCKTVVDKNGVCPNCLTRHEYCRKCALFVAKVGTKQQYCPLCANQIKSMQPDNELLFYRNFPQHIGTIKEFISKQSKPVYEYQLFDLIKDHLIDGFRFSTTHNHMTLPNMLKYVFRKGSGFEKIRPISVIFREPNSEDEEIWGSTKPAICTTEVFKHLNISAWYENAEYEINPWEANLVTENHYKLTYNEASEFIKAVRMGE